MGKLSVGDPLQLLPEPNCGSIDPFVYTLGTGIALSPQANGGCVKVFLNASDHADGCKINWIKGYTEMTMPPIYKLLAAFSAAAPAEFPITPQAQNSNYCGCPDPGNDGESCCTGLDPGELTLQPIADTKLIVAQFSNAQIAANSQSFTFYNIQSWVGPSVWITPRAATTSTGSPSPTTSRRMSTAARRAKARPDPRSHIDTLGAARSCRPSVTSASSGSATSPARWPDGGKSGAACTTGTKSRASTQSIELAAISQVPSRTIRFYQSKGAMARPRIKGRVAYYGAPHLERLKLIAQLQDRGLRIDAIRDLTTRIDKGELDVNEWLGLEAQLQAPWANDEPRTVTEAELARSPGPSGQGSRRRPPRKAREEARRRVPGPEPGAAPRGRAARRRGHRHRHRDRRRRAPAQAHGPRRG